MIYISPAERRAIVQRLSTLRLNHLADLMKKQNNKGFNLDFVQAVKEELESRNEQIQPSR